MSGTVRENQELRIAFVGDIMPGGLFVRAGGVGKEVLDHLKTFDLRIGTLETALGDGSTLCHLKNNPELGTIIFSPDDSVKMLLQMGINAVSLANNHSCDCDLAGLYHTMDVLDRNGILHFGAGHTSEEAAAPAIIHCKGKTICLLGYLQPYHYFYRGPGYIPSATEGGVNIYSLEKVLSDVRKYKALYDYVFVMPHWGTEGSAIPKYREIKDARTIIAVGADGVIGSHAHVVQPVMRYRGGLLAMNLGNFAFPDRYVVNPRISYYPTEEELAAGNIPEVSAFKPVGQLSLKRVVRRERQGIVLGATLSGEGKSFNLYQTELSVNNRIEKRAKVPFPERTSSLFLNLISRDPSGVFLRLFSKLSRWMRSGKN